ncbi:guanylate cyclase domain-containing protein [Haematococcus lacustris]|uniref:Guanylate cyclase domain-containing protein n=1 Tax=Haematococcus lacustris TaxID=44745 RepID=A0A699YC71_HAELA|nr:guanylate cyclase domain-containing protein [Haematococcus lacustris]
MKHGVQQTLDHIFACSTHAMTRMGQGARGKQSAPPVAHSELDQRCASPGQGSGSGVQQPQLPSARLLTCMTSTGSGTPFRGTRPWDTAVRRSSCSPSLPGSTQILDRTTLKLVNCTPALCPMAQPYRTARVAPNVTRTLPGAWVNTAPFPAFGGWTASVAASSPPEVQLATLAFFAYITSLSLEPRLDCSPNNSWADVLNVSGSVDPFRQQHLDPANIGRWTAAGYDQGTTIQYLSALSMAMASPNVALDSRMAYEAKAGRSYRTFFESAYLAVSKNMTDYHMIDALLVLDRSLVQSQQETLQMLGNPDPLELRQQYWYLIGRVASFMFPVPPPLTSGVDSTREVVIGACLAGGLLLLFSLGLLAWQRVVRLRRNHRSALGKLLPPGAGPDTTLVLTDVQDSTTLYECLPVEVMDACMRIAERIIRDLLAAHQGYESATEGDAFLCAFHSPLDAELLHCSGVPCCHPVTASPRPHFNKIVQMVTLSSVKRLSSSNPQSTSLAGCFLRGVRKWLKSQVHYDDRASPPGHLYPTAPVSAFAQDSLLATRLSKGAQSGYDITNGRAYQLFMPRQRSVLQLNMGPLLFTPDDWLAWNGRQSDEQLALSFPIDEDPLMSSKEEEGAAQGGYCGDLKVFTTVSHKGISSSGDLAMSMKPPVQEAGAGQAEASHVTAYQTAVAPVAATTLSSALTQALDSQLRPHQGDAATPSCLVFSGLRIRCGVHTGVASAQDVSYNTSSARMQYSGATLALARAVCDAAQGAQILLSQACFAALPQQQLRDAVAQALPPVRQCSRKPNGGNVSRQVSRSQLESKATGMSSVTSTQQSNPTYAALAGGNVKQLVHSNLMVWHVGEFVLKVGSAPNTAQAVSMPADGSQPAALDAVLVSIDSREEKSKRFSFETTRSKPSKKSLRWDPQQATIDAAPHQLLGQRAKNAAQRSSLALVAAEHCMSPEAAEALHSKPGQQVHSLYSVLLAGLAPRLVLLGAPRAVRQTVPGALSAPYGSACVCFLYVVGLAELLAWDPQEAASALALFSALIKQQLMAWNGYLEHLKQLPWSDRLLAHPLAESLITAEIDSNGKARQTLVYRGLRIKVGCNYPPHCWLRVGADVGAVRTSLQPVTGVMAFRGRVMNRAARIASRAGSGQVLCSAAVWAHWAGNSALASDGL